MSDLAVLRDQHELFGSVASDPTLWRALEEIGRGPAGRRGRAGPDPPARVGVDHGRHGRIPPSRVADRDLGETIVIRMDATIQIAHSDKAGRRARSRAPGSSLPAAWCDNTVRHEALQIRVEVRGLRLPVVAAAGCSWGQPDPGGAGKGGKQPRRSQARSGTTRRAGPGERDETAYERNQCHNAPQAQTPPQTWWIGGGSGASPRGQRSGPGWGTPGPACVVGREATVKDCGVAVARPQGHSWAPHSSIDLK